MYTDCLTAFCIEARLRSADYNHASIPTVRGNQYRYRLYAEIFLTVYYSRYIEVGNRKMRTTNKHSIYIHTDELHLETNKMCDINML